MSLGRAITAPLALAVGLAVGIVVGRRRVSRRGPADVPGPRAYPAGDALRAVGPAVAAPAIPRHAGAPAPVELDELELDPLLAAAGLGIMRVAPDLTVRLASPAAHGLLGRRPGILPGRSVMEVFTDHRAEGLVRHALETGSAGGELAARGRDARTLVLRAQRTEDGDAWLVLQDVSELRRLQRMRAEFIDNLSHELRTPLTTVSLLAETLSRDAGSLPPKAAERVGRIEIEIGHLVQMVNEMLDLARIESGTRLLVLDDVDVVELADGTIGRISLFAERHGVGLRLDAATGVPSVRGDGARLGQALLNLVHNAVKFSASGGEVVIRVRPGEGEVVVAVVDHGIGIPASALPRIFERFFKVDRSRLREGGGTGLGLSIARHVVEAHGGRIWVESEEGAGSTFAFAIPVSGPDEGPDAQPEQPEEPPARDSDRVR